MSEMTLRETDLYKVIEFAQNHPSWTRHNILLWAHEANLIRAPGQVTDEDAATTVRATIERLIRERDEARAALESLSARLAQPVVADDWHDTISEAIACLADVVQFKGNLKIGTYRHIGGKLKALLSQPHPQATQGGEAQDEAVYAVAEDAISEAGHQLYTIHKKRVPNADNWTLYSQPAERAEVPEGWLPIDTAPTNGQRVLLWAKEWSGPWAGNFRQGQWGIIPQDCDLVPQPTHWMPLPAAPTLAGKEASA